MSKKMKVFKWWTGANPEKIEAWLESMELQGWHLVRVNWGGIRFHFEKGDPRKMSYCIDYQNTNDRHYAGIFEDDGWEKLFSSAGWYIWRKSYTDQRPEIFTDIQSLIDRNNRLLGAMSLLFITQLPLFVVNLQNVNKVALITLYTPILAILAFTIIQLTRTNKKLKERKNIH